MRFCHVTYSVKNLDESMEFYQEVIGLSLNSRFAAGDNIEIAFLGSGGTEVELICNKSKEGIDNGRDISLGFEVESLEETIEFLSQKGIASGDIVSFGPKARCIFISDPDGMRVQLMEYRK